MLSKYFMVLDKEDHCLLSENRNRKSAGKLVSTADSAVYGERPVLPGHTSLTRFLCGLSHCPTRMI